MKRILRLLVGLCLLFVVLIFLPFAIPINEEGLDPQHLADDADGAFVPLQGVNIYYEDKGLSDAPTILLVHGLFGSTETWRYNVATLVDNGYRVLTYDRPGFGLSDKVESFNYAVDNQADLMAQLLDHLNIERAIIIGHSAGGNVAAHFAIRHPQRVIKLVLVDAAIVSGGPPAFVGRFVSLPPIFRWGRIGLQAYFTRNNFENTLRSFYSDPSFLTESDYAVYWRAFQTAGWDVGLLGLTRDSAENLLDEATIRQISAETLLIWGSEDTITALDQGETLDTWIPQSTLVTLPNLGHQPFEENPEAFHQTLLEFLR
ncbi:MAG: alpha/beta hydrolase [Anaerolineae bacterium]|jgi:pimeloyl-ACP methyl ester carboxylesterase|nr:alpha/beta hydrolase [Anaerolineae bacterium]